MPFAFAQGAPPAAVSPGLIERDILQEPREPRSAPPTVLPTPEPIIPAPESDQVFVLRAIVIDGNTVFGNDDLADLWTPFLGQEIQVSILFEIAASITARYRNAGYILSRALIPPQEIGPAGIAQIQVVEGYVSDVIREGKFTGPESQFTDKFEKIKASKPLRADVLERYMLLLNDLPGVAAQAVLRPSPAGEPGASELIVVVEEDKISGSLGADSFVSDFLGPARLNGLVTLNNLIGVYDSTEIRGTVSAETERLQFVSLVHTEQLDSEGTFLSGSATYTKTRPGEALEDLDVDGDSFGASAFVSHPFIRSRSENLSVVGGFRVRDSETEDFIGTTADDQLRVISIGATYDAVDRWRGAMLVGAQVSQGLDIFGAEATGQDDPSFTSLLVDLVREQSLASILPALSLRIAAQGQYAFGDRVPTSEVIGFGGEIFGRGYDPFIITGDDGFVTSVELGYGTSTALDSVEGYRVFSFVDTGVLYENDRTVDEEARKSALSAGLGARLNLVSDVTADFVMGVPLNRPPTSDSDEDDENGARFFFRLSKRF